MYAAAFCSAASIKILLDAGADVNARNAFDVTALMWAVNDLEKVRLLIDHGADVKARSKMGRTALLLAVQDDRGLPAVKLLLGKGAEADTRDFIQTTPLIQAANRQIAQLLIERGADVKARNMAGFTALMTATVAGDAEWARMLLSKGADVNEVSGPVIGPPVKNGAVTLGLFTPLLLSAAYGTPELVKLLLDAGADVNAKDVRGLTALMLAIGCDHSDPRVVKLLLERGADPKLKSKDGDDAIAWAKRAGSTEALKALGIKESARDGDKAVAVQADYAKTDLNKAVAKSIGLLQTTSSSFFVKGGCTSCHAHNLTALAVSLARAKGIRVDEAASAGQLKTTKFGWAAFELPLLQRMDPPGGADMTNYGLLGLEGAQHAPEAVTDAMVFNIAAEQRSTGEWHFGVVARPPMEDGDITRTAMAIRSLQSYGMPGRKREFEERIALAKAWLAQAQPRTTEDRNMQMVGLQWAGDTALANRSAKRVRDLQRPNGGWAQTEGLASDAYATGQSLYAFSTIGVPAADPAYRRGVAYLLRAQLADGSWHVASRSPPFQPYFQSGFPHDHDQWISSAATAWAVMALTAAMPDSPVAAGK